MYPDMPSFSIQQGDCPLCEEERELSLSRLGDDKDELKEILKVKPDKATYPSIDNTPPKKGM
jgi:hypothetical protein